jgi:hypothetical protein
VFQHSVRGVYFVVIILFYSIFYLLTETLVLRYFTIIVLLAYLTKGNVSFWIDVSSILNLLQFWKTIKIVIQWNILSQFQICRIVSHVHLYLYPFLLISTIKIQLSRYHYHLSAKFNLLSSLTHFTSLFTIHINLQTKKRRWDV